MEWRVIVYIVRGEEVEINAYGAAIYDWSDGSHDDNITVGDPEEIFGW
ncbi:MAG: hypothetical protein R2771_04325 [Saprospiraceae bacterium]